MIEKIIFKNNIGLNLYGILDNPNEKNTKTLVVICHGMGSSKESLACTMLADKLHKAGIASFRFDFTSHGESEGNYEDVTLSQGINDLKSAIATLGKYGWADQSKIFLFGRSFGGNVVSRYISENNNIKVASLNAPVSDLETVLRCMFAKISIDEWKRVGYIITNTKGQKLSYNIYSDAATHDTYDDAKNIKSKVLIVHGSKDETVPVEQSIKIKECIGKNAELKIIDGVDHKFNPEKMEEAIDISAEFFIKNKNI